MLNKFGRHGLAIVLAAVFLGACATFTTMFSERAQNRGRGLRFVHKIHENEGLDCEVCHAYEEAGRMGMPDHEVCSMCHDFDEDNPDERCDHCHAFPDQFLAPLASVLTDEVKFDHQRHEDGEVTCTQCHADVERSRPPERNIMRWCMDCHGETKPELNECSVCHSELNADVRPTTRQGVPIAHGNPTAWEKLHGRESRRDLEFCLICHDHEASCEECHRRTPPSSHTVAWRGRSHGMRASWDRQQCATCHEEDSCVRCHRQTAPANHRAGWGPPHNRHCISCHFPPSSTQCTVCHERIDHRKAGPSPHVFGLYGNCRNCHPGGVPYRAPHIMNTSVRCLVCH